MTDERIGFLKVTEQTTEIVRTADGGYLCDFCGEAFPTEYQARECSQGDRDQYLRAQDEREWVKVLMGF